MTLTVQRGARAGQSERGRESGLDLERRAVARRVVFLHGVLQRSGTNYLSSLLACHPDCRRGAVFEDFLAPASPLLTRYVETIAGSWNEEWFADAGEDLRARLQKEMGGALLSFLDDDPEKRCLFVTKTPSTLNLESCFALFPDSRTIVIMRDGRDVVESGMRTFAWGWESAVRQWVLSAHRAREFLEKYAGSKRVLLVRYEDLFKHPRPHIRRILEFLELEAERFDWGAAESAPVFGSCAYGRDGASPVDWRPVSRQADFWPLERYRNWSQRRCRRFAWLAGEVSAAFGYAAVEGLRGNAIANALDWTLDRCWQTGRRWSETCFLLKRALLDPAPDFSTGLHHYYQRGMGPAERTPSLLPRRD